MTYVVLALSVFVISFILGFVFAAMYDVNMTISRKEDYEAKIEALESLIEQMEKPVEDKGEYKTAEMFPPGVLPEYGIPRKLGE